MPYGCLVSTCKNYGPIPGIRYYSIGKHRYKNWIKAIGRSLEENLSPKNVVCSEHFVMEDFYQIGGNVYLKKSAIPKRNSPYRRALKRTCGNTNNEPSKIQRIMVRPLAKTTINVDSLPALSLAETIKIPSFNIDTNDGSTSVKSSDEIIKELPQSSSDSAAGLRGSPKQIRKLIKKIHTYAATPEKLKQDLRCLKRKYTVAQRKLKIEKQKTRRLRKILKLNSKDIVEMLKQNQLLSRDACSVSEKPFSDVLLAIMKCILPNSVV